MLKSALTYLFLFRKGTRPEPKKLKKNAYNKNIKNLTEYFSYVAGIDSLS